MQRRFIWVSLYVLLVSSTVVMKVKGLPKSAERLLDGKWSLLYAFGLVIFFVKFSFQ